MFQTYLVTGASGFLGRAVLSELLSQKASVRALVMENDPLADTLPPSVPVVYGDVLNNASLERFFAGADRKTCVIHCAGMISVASDPGDKIYRVNVGGTNNILRYCEKKEVGKLVYVSSVHAIPEKPKGRKITADAVFSPDRVNGAYAKSKAIATALVYEAADRGLDASVVFPSGIIGPGDIGKGSITNLLLQFLSGKLSLAVKGGYDFVDVRDVAKGIFLCSEHGRPGQGYILSGQYASIRGILEAAGEALHSRHTVLYLPVRLAKLIAPFYEKRCIRLDQPLYFTPSSVAVLDSNGSFSRRSSAADLGYAPRPLKNSIKDTMLWLKKYH